MHIYMCVCESVCVKIINQNSPQFKSFNKMLYIQRQVLK